MSGDHACPILAMATKKGRRYMRAGIGGRLWEELEMGLQRRSRARI